MAEDEKTAADNELARRRQEREEAAAAAASAGSGGKSLEELADDDDGAELFPAGILDGDGKSLKTLIPKGAAVRVSTSMLSGKVPSRKGLFDPEKTKQVVVTCEVAHYKPVPHREEGQIVDWEIVQVLRPTHFEPVVEGEEPSAASG